MIRGAEARRQPKKAVAQDKDKDKDKEKDTAQYTQVSIREPRAKAVVASQPVAATQTWTRRQQQSSVAKSSAAVHSAAPGIRGNRRSGAFTVAGSTGVTVAVTVRIMMMMTIDLYA